ncbi:hypothetical protein BX600DRAFT_54760 [Xylariales sp. PMI_506]|nr:hypothetical protein BX600DRAFT_54760 [Xylariales sp. PMI_506]
MSGSSSLLLILISTLWLERWRSESPLSPGLANENAFGLRYLHRSPPIRDRLVNQPGHAAILKPRCGLRKSLGLEKRTTPNVQPHRGARINSEARKLQKKEADGLIRNPKVQDNWKWKREVSCRDGHSCVGDAAAS